ncbi:MAG TPA: rhodanese-like domain-containing protein [bacterium]|jgi:rhodanese-related sulfurtransferase|nr:rhodanese-like domain-containing protein [bacterium]HNT67006.1 rhodanese-like domain-containing protein [bacterium]
MRWIPQKAVRQSTAFIALAFAFGMVANTFHPKKVTISFSRPSLQYAADSLLGQELSPVAIEELEGHTALPDHANGEPISVNSQQVRNLLLQGRAELLDARSQDEYEAGHLPGARLLPVERLFDYPKVIEQLSRDKWLICYCDGPPCDLGELLAWELLGRDFQKIAVYQDGLNEWKKFYPLEFGKEKNEFEN